MSFKLALTGTTGKLGGAVLAGLLEQKLIHPSSLVLSTSSDPTDSRWDDLKRQGAEVRQANFDDPESFEKAFAGCDRAFIVSSSAVALDFDNCAKGGREKHHIAVIEAARRAGVKHFYYPSLGFADDSKSEVMRAHLVTEKYLRENVNDIGWTVLREGLYSESWPMYFGHWTLGSDDRQTVKVAGDGLINWTSIPDLGLASASIIVDDPEKWNRQFVTLSGPKSHDLKALAKLVSKALGKDISLQVVSREEHEDYYINERKMDPSYIKWWSRTFEALNRGECEMSDTTLVDLLKAHGKQPKPMEETVAEMLKEAE